MSADSISSAISGGAQRAAAMPAAAAPAKVEKAVQAAALAKAPDAPEKAKIDFDPKQQHKDLQEAIDQLNQQMRDNGRALEFGIDESLDRTIVTVKNSETGQVVRQIPNETVLRVAHHLEDVKGLLQDEHI